LNCAEIPKLQRIALINGLRSLTWAACKGSSYRVQYKDLLSDLAWNDLAGDVTATGFAANKADDTNASSQCRFYRVIELPSEHETQRANPE